MHCGAEGAHRSDAERFMEAVLKEHRSGTEGVHGSGSVAHGSGAEVAHGSGDIPVVDISDCVFNITPG